MKKLLLLLVTHILVLGSAKADEGMWTLMNLPQAVYDKMVEEGYKMDYDQLYHDKEAIYHAVVNFGGFCSGVVVSQDGLVFTNHHCGFEAISNHSTMEHDYLKNGFVAQSFAEELPNENLFVSFMIAQKDITSYVEEHNFRELSQNKQEELLYSIEQLENKRIKLMDPTLHAELKPYYERNSFYIDIYQDFNDIRLVFTAPKSMGKFGGETDNWMWPRQTADFSVFRIYADPKTNGPAAYSEENVPYHPKNWARVSLDGYQEGDFAMTMGYPGTTNRYLSSFGIAEQRDLVNTPRWQTREIKQKVMRDHMNASEEVRIKYEPKYAKSSNYWKNAIGMNKCIDSLNIIGLKQAHERAIQAYVNSTGFLKGKLDLDKLASLYEKRASAVYAYTLFKETFDNDELSVRAIQFTTGGMPMKGPKDKPKKQYAQFDDNSSTYDIETDKAILAALLKNYKEKAEPVYMPGFIYVIEMGYGGDYAKFVNDIYSKTRLLRKNLKITDPKRRMKDVGVTYGLDLTDTFISIQKAYNACDEEINEQERYLCAAKLRMEQDMPHYSDANFTLRMSYGQVAQYDKYGSPSGWFTTPESLVAKMKKGDENSDYKAEDALQQLFAQNNFGRYADKKLGTMPLCFLTTNDITGGNSGSPVFDGKNRLIGLAFDGNWESLSSKLNYDIVLGRCICIDVRYMLFLMDKWGHADRLIKEINAQ